MNNQDSQNKPMPSNIDTTIEETRFVHAHDKNAFLKIDSVQHDGDDGVINRVVNSIPVDSHGRPITDMRQIAGKCGVCSEYIVFGEEIICGGRCGRMLCRSCYQRQGSHELHGIKYCRHDYWITRLFWQFISPAIRNRRTENGHEEYNRQPGHNAVGDFRQVRTAQQENRQPDKVYIIKAQ